MVLIPGMRPAAFAVCCAMIGMAHAADPLPAVTQLVAASTAPAPVQESFTVTSTEDLVVTLTDLQIPAELVSASVVVTQAGAISGSGQLTNPATNASVSLAAASGIYTLYVFGVPNASYSIGTFSVCVALKASPSNCIQTTSLGETVSFSGNVTAQNSAKDPTVSTLSTPLSVATAGSYTFNFSDLAFPTALNVAPMLLLSQGSNVIIPPGQARPGQARPGQARPGQTSPGIIAGTALTLSPGSYTLLSIAQADQVVQQGLYGITIAGASGTTPLLDTSVAVGLLGSAVSCANPSSQNLTLTVADYGFPGALASASALLTSGGTIVGSASAAGGAQSVIGPAGNLTLWTYGSASGSAGTFSADVSSGAADLCTTAQAVSLSGSTYTYAYVVPAPTLTTAGVYANTPLSAGAYTVTATDLQFPSQLGGLSFAVAQNGVILQQSTTAATLNFTAASGNAIVLVSAVAPTSTTSPNGLFDVNVQAGGAAASLVFDKTQSVSTMANLFSVQTLTVADNDSYDVSLKDLSFPAAFDSLALVVSRGSEVLGKVFGAGTFSFAGSPGTYQLTFVATPSADQQFGMYSDSVVYSPPTVTLTSSAATAVTGASISLMSSATNASSCTASGGWTGVEPTTATTTAETLAATTTYTLSCTGNGGTASQSVTVTATAAPSHSSGGGAIDTQWLLVLSGLTVLRRRRSKLAAPGR